MAVQEGKNRDGEEEGMGGGVGGDGGRRWEGREGCDTTQNAAVKTCEYQNSLSNLGDRTGGV